MLAEGRPHRAWEMHSDTISIFELIERVLQERKENINISDD